MDFKKALDQEIVRVAHLLKELRSCRNTLDRLDREAEALLGNAPKQTLTAQVKVLFEQNNLISTAEAIRLTKGKPTSVSPIISRLRREAKSKHKDQL